MIKSGILEPGSGGMVVQEPSNLPAPPGFKPLIDHVCLSACMFSPCT